PILMLIRHREQVDGVRVLIARLHRLLEIADCVGPIRLGDRCDRDHVLRVRHGYFFGLRGGFPLLVLTRKTRSAGVSFVTACSKPVPARLSMAWSDIAIRYSSSSVPITTAKSIRSIPNGGADSGFPMSICSGGLPHRSAMAARTASSTVALAFRLRRRPPFFF